MSVWEIAEFEVRPGAEAAFEQHVADWVDRIREAGDADVLRLQRAVDVEHRIVMQVRWSSLQAHRDFVQTEVFRGFFGGLQEHMAGTRARVFHAEDTGIGF